MENFGIEVSIDYPKCFAAVGAWLVERKEKDPKQSLKCYYDRSLYDFFDEHSIFVTVIYDDRAATKGFDFQVISETRSSKTEGYRYSRAEAEEDAFRDAFIMLEEKLSQKDK